MVPVFTWKQISWIDWVKMQQTKKKGVSMILLIKQINAYVKDLHNL